MLPLLELHARSLQLRHLAKCLQPLPVGTARNEHRAPGRTGGHPVSYPVRPPWLLLISAAIFSADRWTKTWVAAHIALGGAIPVVPGLLRITHWLNEGAAFSLFADTASPRIVRLALIVFTCVA